jgi:ribosomal protein L37E
MLGYDRNKIMACEICGKQQYRVNDPKTVVSNCGLTKGVRCNEHEETEVVSYQAKAVTHSPLPTFDAKGRLISGMR